MQIETSDREMTLTDQNLESLKILVADDEPIIRINPKEYFGLMLADGLSGKEEFLTKTTAMQFCKNIDI